MKRDCAGMKKDRMGINKECMGMKNKDNMVRQEGVVSGG